MLQMVLNKWNETGDFTEKAEMWRAILPEQSRKSLEFFSKNLAEGYKGKEWIVERWQKKTATVWLNGNESEELFITDPEPIWHVDGLKHMAQDGTLRRSKSEVILDEILHNLGLVYAYERPLYIGNRRYLPDYTILRPGDLKPVFVEHFGLTGEGTKEYGSRNDAKRWQYQKAGIVPWKNLLYTYDLPDGTIDVTSIRKALKLFLEI